MKLQNLNLNKQIYYNKKKLINKIYKTCIISIIYSDFLKNIT